MTKPKANPKPSPWKSGLSLQGTWRCHKCQTINKRKLTTTCQKCGEVIEK